MRLKRVLACRILSRELKDLLLGRVEADFGVDAVEDDVFHWELVISSLTPGSPLAQACFSAADPFASLSCTRRALTCDACAGTSCCVQRAMPTIGALLLDRSAPESQALELQRTSIWQTLMLM